MSSKQDSVANLIEQLLSSIIHTKAKADNLVNDPSQSYEENESISQRHLILRPTGSRPETLDDLMLVMAATIEDSLLEAGATHDEYSILELYQLAQPFCLEMFKNNNISFTTSWPSYKEDDRVG